MHIEIFSDMKKPLFLIIAVFLSLLYGECIAQSTFTISKPQLQLVNGNVSIFYDILNADQSEKFNISLVVTDSDGKLVYAHSLIGDIGESVTGGSGKEINWNLGADNIYLEAMLYFQVNATIIPSEKSSKADKTTETNIIEGSGNLSRSSVILQSLVMPGLGLSKITGKPHWIKGVLGYGCIVSSVAFNINSSIKYNEYQLATDITERDDLYELSTNQKNISKIQLYAAIGIWAVDFIWTIAGSKKLSKNVAYGQTKGLSIQPSFDIEENVPLLAFRYNF